MNEPANMLAENFAYRPILSRTRNMAPPGERSQGVPR
jgi:hypothetical protein